MSFDTRHDELRLGDIVLSCDGHELRPPAALVDVLDPTLLVHEMRIERRVNKKKRDKVHSFAWDVSTHELRPTRRVTAAL